MIEVAGRLLGFDLGRCRGRSLSRKSAAPLRLGLQIQRRDQPAAKEGLRRFAPCLPIKTAAGFEACRRRFRSPAPYSKGSFPGTGDGAAASAGRPRHRLDRPQTHPDRSRRSAERVARLGIRRQARHQAAASGRRHQRRAGRGLRIERRQKSRRGPRLNQRRAQAVAHKVVHQALLAEAHLGFGRVHVHVDFFGRHLQKQQHHRESWWAESRCDRPR